VPSSLIARNVQCEVLEEMPIPLHVVAVDVISGEELRLSGGPIVDAVLASAAIPGVVAPVRWHDRTPMDGGVANNTPISHAVELGAERIYVLPTGHACALEEPPRGALAVALHAISLLTQRRLIDDIERHRDAARLVVLPSPCPLGIQPIDFGHADELIDRALSDAREFLDDGRATAAARRPLVGATGFEPATFRPPADERPGTIRPSVSPTSWLSAPAKSLDAYDDAVGTSAVLPARRTRVRFSPVKHCCFHAKGGVRLPVPLPARKRRAQIPIPMLSSATSAETGRNGTTLSA
jgi:hypothetical protein